jgi:hypothetical protein
MDTVCIIGHSHGHMLKKGLKFIKNESFNYITPLIGTKAFTHPASFKADNAILLNKDVDSLIDHLKKGQGLESIHLLTAFHGNGYNQFYMIEDDEPFDFIFDDENVDDKLRFVSKQMVETGLDTFLINTRNALSILMQKGIGSVACIQTPPPNPSAEFMMDKLRIVRSDLTGDFKVTSSRLRHKLWLTMDSMYRKMCGELGVIYVCAPKETIDSNGFLLEKYWADMSHANELYGSILLDEHQKLINNLD